MAGGFGDYRTALRFREAVAGIAEEVVNRLRPTYRYATVQAINAVAREVTVRFPGETSDVIVAAGALIPSAVGQTVRVAGVGGERYIGDVLGEAQMDVDYNKSATFADPPSSYPNRVSARYMSSGVGGPTGAGSWTTLTVKRSDTVIWQIANTRDSTPSGDATLWYRQGHGGGTPEWGPWQPLLKGQTDAVWREVGATGQPGYQNGWVRYDLTYSPARFRRDAQGFVHVDGMVRSGTTGATIFTLPVGYRPGVRLLLRQMSIDQICRVDILPDGIVTHMSGGSNGWVSLDGIVFHADN